MKSRLGSILFIVSVSSFPLALIGCVSTSMQGYADRDLPVRGLSHLVTYVQAPPSIASELRNQVAAEASRRGLVNEDAYSLFPPTRTYSDGEIRKELVARQADGILIISAADSGISREYAGTIFNAQYNQALNGQGLTVQTGNVSSTALSGSISGNASGMSTAIYRPRRETVFEARLLEPSSGRTLWVGNGQVSSSGKLFVLASLGPSQSVTAVFNDLQNKGLISQSR